MTFDFDILARAKRAWQNRSEPEAARMLGVLFWRSLLIFALVLFLAALWFGFQELDAVSQAENVPAAGSTPPPPVSSAQIQSELDSLSARQQQFQSLSQSPGSAPADPSQ